MPRENGGKKRKKGGKIHDAETIERDKTLVINLNHPYGLIVTVPPGRPERRGKSSYPHPFIITGSPTPQKKQETGGAGFRPSLYFLVGPLPVGQLEITTCRPFFVVYSIVSLFPNISASMVQRAPAALLVMKRTRSSTAAAESPAASAEKSPSGGVPVVVGGLTKNNSSGNLRRVLSEERIQKALQRMSAPPPTTTIEYAADHDEQQQQQQSEPAENKERKVTPNNPLDIDFSPREKDDFVQGGRGAVTLLAYTLGGEGGGGQQQHKPEEKGKAREHESPAPAPSTAAVVPPPKSKQQRDVLWLQPGATKPPIAIKKQQQHSQLQNVGMPSSNPTIANAYSAAAATGSSAVIVAPEEKEGGVISKFLLDALVTSSALDAMLNTALSFTSSSEQQHEHEAKNTTEESLALAALEAASRRHIVAERQLRAELLTALRRRVQETEQLKKELGRVRRELDDLRHEGKEEEE